MTKPNIEPQSNTASNKVRDFIYLDSDRLYSLNSQIFKGLRGRVVNNLRKMNSGEDSQKGPILQGSETKTGYEDEWSRMEDVILHDHLYDQLEDALSDSMLDATTITPSNYRDILQSSTFVKVRGSAEIIDFERMSYIMDNYERLGDGIAYSVALGDGSLETSKKYKQLMTEAKAGLKDATTEEERANWRTIINELDKFKDEKAVLQRAKDNLMDNFGVDMLTHLSYFNSLFYKDGFDINIKPEHKQIIFRGIINKEWLRVTPETLKALYSGVVDFQWVMVGHVTKLPQPNSGQESSVDVPEVPFSESPSIKDALRGMSGATNYLESLYFQSSARIEGVSVILCKRVEHLVR